MTLSDFAALVRTMRRDQRAFAEHRTSAAAMKARYSERLVDEALAGMPEAEPDKADEPMEVGT